jgi:hypothetical protein
VRTVLAGVALGLAAVFTVIGMIAVGLELSGSLHDLRPASVPSIFTPSPVPSVFCPSGQRVTGTDPSGWPVCAR